MTEREATLREVLDNREQRVLRQRRLLQQYPGTLICFTMNIPGPVKNNLWIRGGFRLGKRLLLDLLRSAAIEVYHQEEICAVTGCEGFFLVDAPAEKIKALTVRIEDSMEVGRLFDMDVLRPDGKKLSREELGMGGRACLLCGRPASICGPVRAHSAQELWQRTAQLLRAAVTEDFARYVGAMAAKALLYEVCTTPKPGLVDRENAGAHRDMDIYTFMGSSAVLQPYFTRCAEIGIKTREQAAEETFRQIRFAGMLAEQEMYRQTRGINTHKGAVFSMGLACGASAGAGTLPSRGTAGAVRPDGTGHYTAGSFRYHPGKCKDHWGTALRPIWHCRYPGTGRGGISCGALPGVAGVEGGSAEGAGSGPGRRCCAAGYAGRYG